MYSNIITAIVLTIILVTLAMMFINVTSLQHSYTICKIANITIGCSNNKCYITSSRPAIIHIYLIYSNNKIRHTVCYTSCQVSRAPLIVAITPYDIEYHGDLKIISHIMYLSPCGVTTYSPNRYPWIQLPTERSSMLTRLSIRE